MSDADRLDDARPGPRIMRLNLSTQILLGLLSGIAVGLFFGELVAELKVFGDVFVALLQMTVLPYIMVSLIGGLGRMDPALGRRLAWRGLLVLLLVWVLALVLVFSVQWAFPVLDLASFFSSSEPLSRASGNLLELYIPANIFYSLSNNLVPAVVLFSILMGVALISVESKQGLLDLFEGLRDALARINVLIIRLTPLGLFAISASAAGTMTIAELGKVQVYLFSYTALALLVTFWVFPGLVSTVTGIPYRTVLNTYRDALVTAFATGNQFVVLPLIAENTKAMLEQHGNGGSHTGSAVDVIIPVAFNFPSLGKIFVLLFVLFAAWFNDVDLGFAEQLNLAVTGLFSLFGSINVAIPYLLDSFRIPADMFQLFLVTGVIIGRLGAMLAALHIVVIAVIGAVAISDGLRFSAVACLRYLGISVIGLVLLVIALRAYFHVFVPAPASREEVLGSITLLNERAPVRVFDHAVPAPAGRDGADRVETIINSGVLRVGYRPSNLPCSFRNSGSQLVGFDVEMAHLFAEDMGLELEFAPFEFDSLGIALKSGTLDIAMSCIASLPDRFRTVSFSRSYLDLTLALAVPDHRRADFSSVEAIRSQERLRVAMVGTGYFGARLQRRLPNVELIEIDSAEAFFSSEGGVADALLISAEEGAAYSFRYPHFTIIRPLRDTIRLPVAYALPKGDQAMIEWVSNWVELKQKDGSIARLYEYWMLGGAARERQPRWSIIRDVLHWID